MNRRLLRQTNEEVGVSGTKRSFATETGARERRGGRVNEEPVLDRQHCRSDWDPATNEEMDERFRFESDFDRKLLRVYPRDRYLHLPFYCYFLNIVVSFIKAVLLDLPYLINSAILSK